MIVENENFFDFFGITEGELRTVYSSNTRIPYTPDISVPVPGENLLKDGIKTTGIKVITNNKSSTDMWLNIALIISIIALICVIIYVIWDYTRPEPVKIIPLPEPEIEKVKVPR